jgi:hypothetical protein
MKVLEIMDRSLQNSSNREMNQQQRTQFVQIVGSISNSAFGSPLAASIQGDVMGDKYTVGQAGAVGPKSSAHDISFTQVWNQSADAIDLPALKNDLTALRAALKAEAKEPEEDIAVAEVAAAEVAASKGDGPKVLEHLAKAGRWALKVATEIGTLVAAAAINTALGLPPS